MSETKYDKAKWKCIMDTTQNNYANMIKRLTRKSKISNYTLIYYSIFLIISSLTSKFFPNFYNCTLSEYFNIILSVIILAYSLVNNSANYSVRIARIEKSLNNLKNIKREINDFNLKECIAKYIEITDKTERREDIDFFVTTIDLCRKCGIPWIVWIFGMKKVNQNENDDDVKAAKDHLCEINIFYEVIKLVLEYVWYLFLFVVPILVFWICLKIK